MSWMPSDPVPEDLTLSKAQKKKNKKKIVDLQNGFINDPFRVHQSTLNEFKPEKIDLPKKPLEWWEELEEPTGEPEDPDNADDEAVPI